MRKAILLVLIGLQACTYLPYEKEACRDFVAYPALTQPPQNVEALYALENFGRPGPRYHEHWYQLSDDMLVACRHLRAERGGCGTQQTRFFKTKDGWEAGNTEMVVCAD
jgi:hypothetical protein